MKLLAFCGSLRAASLNAALLRAMVRLAPAQVAFLPPPDLGGLPLFNPDRDPLAIPTVAALYSAVAEADALVFASPEYAHGVTGTIKNALDWLVGLEAFCGKPVAVLNASSRAHHADAALRETLRTMSATLVEDASLVIPLLGAGLNEDGMVESADIASLVRRSLDALVRGIAESGRGSEYEGRRFGL